MKSIKSKGVLTGLALSATLTLAGIVGFAQQGTAQGQGGQERTGRQTREGFKGMRGKGMRAKRGAFGGHFARNLNLSDAQKEQMKQIAERYRESSKALREQAGVRRGAGSFSDGTFDEAAVRAAAVTRANARVELEVLRARMMSEMYTVLTSEQKSQLAAQRQERQQRLQERRSRRGAGSSQTQ